MGAAMPSKRAVRRQRRQTQERAPATVGELSLRNQVAAAVRNYSGLPPVPVGDADSEEGYLASPNRLAFALGWIVAGQIVGARFRDSAIDVLPIYHPENGWDRFLLTRRVSCTLLREESANSFGMLMLDGEDAPRLTYPDGNTRLVLGPLLQREPEQVMSVVLRSLPQFGLVPGEHGLCEHERDALYPTLYQVVAEIIAEHPGVVAAREIYVDDQAVEGTYHPLYLHGAARHPQMVYEFFGIQSPDWAAFFRIGGSQSIYETDQGGWSTVVKQLADEDRAGMKRRILSWLRIDGGPVPEVD
jgi:hypothetical protein